MFPAKDFLKRFREVLDELDALCEDCADADAAEDLDELNAELDDALMLLGELRQDDADWQEDAAGALEEIEALASDYRRLAGRVEGLAPLAERLEMAAKLAESALDGVTRL